MPARFAEHLTHRDRQRREAEAEAARIAELQKTTYPNQQVPPSVAFPPDPPERSMQGKKEYVNFTLAGGGRIKKFVSYR